ncbi:DUF6308 family protein [Streptomyces sp. NPDC007206]|uniref:DUF6308 family protein n=1 Tax=Streptomyces sp. NPDC007206 TaxID=3154317 RepID=UPI0033EE90CB
MIRVQWSVEPCCRCGRAGRPATRRGSGPGVEGAALRDSKVRVGGRSAEVEVAARWVRSYFNESANRAAAAAKRGKPFAYPLYDRMATGSGPDELNDGDFLAPLLLNAGPTMVAVYSLQAVRPVLEAGLAAIPQDLTLQTAVVCDRHWPLFEGLIGVLDAPARVPGIGLTKLTKILHRKRPLFVPLFDRQVKACYYSTHANYPMHPTPGRPVARFFSTLAACMTRDLEEQPEQWKVLAAQASNDVSLLRILDVVAWNLGAGSPGPTTP